MRWVWQLTRQMLPEGWRQVQRDCRPSLEVWKVQKVQGQVQDLAAYAADAHEEAVLVVEAHNAALAFCVLQISKSA